MIRKYRFLSVLMLAVCLSASFFMPSKVNAYGLSCWFDGCDELTEREIESIAEKALSTMPDNSYNRDYERYLNCLREPPHQNFMGYSETGTGNYSTTRNCVAPEKKDDFYDMIGKTNCEQCAKNVSAINAYVQKNWQSLCREANRLDKASKEEQDKTMKYCEAQRKQMAEDTARELACSDQEAKNVYGMSGAIVSGSVAALAGGAAIGFTAAAVGVAVGVITAPVSVPVLAVAAAVTGVVAGVAAVGSWLFGRQVESEVDTFGAKFTEILNKFLGENNGCWFCSSFDLLFDNINNVATNLYNELRGLFLALLAIFTMAWLLWTVFKFITTIHGPNVGELMTKLFKGLGAAMLIAIVLRAPPYFITGYIVDPFATLGTELSSEILKAQGMEPGTVEYTAYSRRENGYYCGSVTLAVDVTVNEAVAQKETRTLCETVKEDDERFKNKALSAGVYSGMICLLRTISAELILGLALGATLISEGIRGGFQSVFPQFDVLATGIIVFFAYFLLFVKVPFKLIDLLFRLGFVIILLPLFIVCMVTPATRGYSKKAWDMLLGCWISLIALCLSVSLTITLMSDTLMRDVEHAEEVLK